MKKHYKWKIADYLSRVACWLRGQKWYASDNYSNVPGNRAAELKQRIWENVVTMNHRREFLNGIERDLDELGQMAGENWGHINARP